MAVIPCITRHNMLFFYNYWKFSDKYDNKMTKFIKRVFTNVGKCDNIIVSILYITSNGGFDYEEKNQQNTF